MRRDVAKQVTDDAKRQVVGLDAVGHRHCGKLWHQRPVTADRAFDKPIVRESVQAPFLAVARCCGEDQRQRLRARSGAKAPLECFDEFVRRSAADKTRNCDRVSVANDGECLVRRHDLVFHFEGL